MVLVVLIVTLGLNSLEANAGGGTYVDGSPDLLTLNVLFEFDTSASFDPNSAWEGAFNRASELLFNATDGQVQIGTVNFYNNCPQVVDQADVLIQSGSGGASAHVGGLGDDGLHVYVYNDTHSQDVATARGHFGIVHEFGHYVFGLYDSYIDKDKNATSCINDTSTVVTIMDGGTTVQPNNQRTEFTLPRDQASCNNTAQFQIRNMVDWPWIVQYVKDEYGATLTQPADYNTAMPAGHAAVTYKYFNCGLRAVICADASGSMEGTKMNMLRAGARLFVDLTTEDDGLGVVAFGNDATTIFDIDQMTAENKSSAKLWISAILAGGGTNIGGGLQWSLGLIEAEGDPLSNEVIILMSDGLHNGDTDPYQVLPQLVSRGVRVFTIGLGEDADPEMLTDIATSTGGSYYFASDVSVLTAHFASILSEMRNNGTIAKVTEQIDSGETRSETISIDNYTQQAGEATFVLSWGMGDLDLILRRPDGSTVSPADPDVSLHVDEGLSQMYRMAGPMAGDWIAQIQSNQASTLFTLQASSEAGSQVSVITTTDRDYYLAGEPIQIQTSVSAPASGRREGTPVEGVQVTGRVLINGVFKEDIAVYDDGDLAHGDYRTQDGVYSALYYALEEGNFTFEITAVNTNGQTAPPNEEYPGFVPLPVDPFVRVSETTVFVEMPPGGVVQPQPSAAPPSPPISGGGGGGIAIVFIMLVAALLGVYVLTSRRAKDRTAAPAITAHLLFPDGAVAKLTDGFTIGRSASSSLRIDDPAVSRQHARFRHVEGAWFIQDAGSKIGTHVNGQPVQAAQLKTNDQISIGTAIMIFRER
jgi:Mg-chelatase subunit ChlD